MMNLLLWIAAIIVSVWLVIAVIGLLFHPLVWMIVAGIVIGGLILSALNRPYY